MPNTAARRMVTERALHDIEALAVEPNTGLQLEVDERVLAVERSPPRRRRVVDDPLEVAVATHERRRAAGMEPSLRSTRTWSAPNTSTSVTCGSRSTVSKRGRPKISEITRSTSSQRAPASVERCETSAQPLVLQLGQHHSLEHVAGHLLAQVAFVGRSRRDPAPAGGRPTADGDRRRPRSSSSSVIASTPASVSVTSSQPYWFTLPSTALLRSRRSSARAPRCTRSIVDGSHGSQPANCSRSSACNVARGKRTPTGESTKTTRSLRLRSRPGSAGDTRPAACTHSAVATPRRSPPARDHEHHASAMRKQRPDRRAGAQASDVDDHRPVQVAQDGHPRHPRLVAGEGTERIGRSGDDAQLADDVRQPRRRPRAGARARWERDTLQSADRRARQFAFVPASTPPAGSASISQPTARRSPRGTRRRAGRWWWHRCRATSRRR